MSIGSCLDSRGRRGGLGGQGSTGFGTTEGSRTGFFRSFSGRLFLIGLSSIRVFFFGSVFIMTDVHLIHFNSDPDFGSGFSCVFI